MIGTILIFLAILSVLVLVHEWGHYFFAKRFGVKVEEFGLGFPPRAFAWKAKDGMTWSLNWIPLGGYVKIKGESGENRHEADSFGHKPILARMLVLAAGVIMNFVLAAVLFSFGFLVGIPSVVEGDLGASAKVTDKVISISQVLPDSPADVAGVKPGDTVTAVNGNTYTTGQETRDALVPLEGQATLDVTVLRDGESVTIPIEPTYFEEYDKKMIGVGVVETGIVRYPWYMAPWKGIETTYLYTRDILAAFGAIIRNLFEGEKAGVEVAGPIGIAVMTGEVASLGVVYLIQFAAILSINLAIINVFPFPALDGGRLLFVTIEAIRRKPNNPAIEAVVHNVGFALLMLLVIVVTYKDIVGLIKG